MRLYKSKTQMRLSCSNKGNIKQVMSLIVSWPNQVDPTHEQIFMCLQNLTNPSFMSQILLENSSLGPRPKNIVN